MKSSLLALSILIASPAFASDKYASPDLAEYFASLMQPDNGMSCCGEADSYWCDTLDQDPDGELVCIITDTRPDESIRGYRIPREVGTRVRIPRNKIRKHPIPNPTGHTLVFLSSAGAVYCFEPLPGG